jgi:hypothetical protein
MIDDPTPGRPSGTGTEKSLLLDDLDEKLATFRAFRHSDQDATNGILNTLGAQDDVDRDIVLELSATEPLGHPDRFDEAHRLAIRALEVLDRNGTRTVRVSGLGPLGPPAGFLAQQVAQFIIRSHMASVTDEMLRLYSRREAATPIEHADRRRLMVARIQMERVSPGFKRNALGAAAFLFGGAVFSTLMSAIGSAARSALDQTFGKVVISIVLALVVFGVAWVLLRGAAVARRRIHITLDGPIDALWQTIGRCGKPPRDPATVFGLIALVLAVVPFLVVPIGLALQFLL